MQGECPTHLSDPVMCSILKPMFHFLFLLLVSPLSTRILYLQNLFYLGGGVSHKSFSENLRESQQFSSIPAGNSMEGPEDAVLKGPAMAGMIWPPVQCWEEAPALGTGVLSEVHAGIRLGFSTCKACALTRCYLLPWKFWFFTLILPTLLPLSLSPRCVVLSLTTPRKRRKGVIVGVLTLES